MSSIVYLFFLAVEKPLKLSTKTGIVNFPCCYITNSAKLRDDSVILRSSSQNAQHQNCLLMHLL